MRNIFSITAIGLLLFSCAATTVTVSKVAEAPVERQYHTAGYAGPKQKVAVTRFENATRFGQRRLGDNISNVLMTELGKTERFILLERAGVDQILDQVKLSQAGLTAGTLDQIKLLDADYIITGAVTQYAVSTTGSDNLISQSKIQKADVAADVRLINVRTGEVVLSETGGGTAQKTFSKVLGMGATGGYDESLEGAAFRAAVVKLIENIVAALDKAPWVCDVVKITADKIYIDAGKKSNLKTGDILELYQKGEAITDLAGRVLGYEETLAAEGTVVGFLGEDGAILNSSSGTALSLPLICKIKK